VLPTAAVAEFIDVSVIGDEFKNAVRFALPTSVAPIFPLAKIS
jgi:hypothetical protein